MTDRLYAHPRLSSSELCLFCILVPKEKNIYAQHALTWYTRTDLHVVCTTDGWRPLNYFQTVFCFQQTSRSTLEHSFIDCLSNELCLVLHFPSSAIGSRLTNQQTLSLFWPIKISLYLGYTCFPTLGNSDLFLLCILIGSFCFFFVVRVNTMVLVFMTVTEKLFNW